MRSCFRSRQKGIHRLLDLAKPDGGVGETMVLRGVAGTRAWFTLPHASLGVWARCSMLVAARHLGASVVCHLVVWVYSFDEFVVQRPLWIMPQRGRLRKRRLL